MSSGDGHRRVGLPRPASVRSSAAHVRALVGEQRLAERRVDRVAPERRLVRRDQPPLAREQVLRSVDVGAVRHHSAPVTNGPWAAGSP